MRHLASFIVASAIIGPALVLSSWTPAHAARVCVYDEKTQTQRCTITVEPGGPNQTVAFDSIPIGWRRNIANAGPAVGFCVRNEVIDGIETTIVGTPWIVELFDIPTGDTISINQVCEFPGDEPPQPPPPPPTPEQYIEAIEELLVVDFELSPPAEFEGITGVDTWFWCNTPDTAAIAPITLDGWTVEAEMNAILFSWSVSGPGDGGSSDSETCGTEPALDGDGDGAAWKWQPQTLGDYTINFTSTWLGTWTQTYDGTNVGTFPLGPAPIDQEPVTYPVGEYVGVLTGE